MKRFIACILLAIALIAALALPAMAEEAAENAQAFTWEYLASIAGATAFTLLAVQMIKAPLDMVWRIPTRLLVYIISLGVLLLGTAFTSGLTVESALLCAVNACVVALSAFGAYELTFSKNDNY